MDVVYRKLADLKPYENNPRINDSAVAPVAQSIKDFGFKQPIVVNKDNVIIVGHTRYKAAQMLGLEEVPVVYADLSPEQEAAYRIVDNKSGELATWDWSKLNFEFAKAIEEGQVDMSAYGFDIDADAVLESLKHENEQNLREGEELDLDEFDDEKFKYECPECGMRFN